mmetsp:Transcript_36168/g.80487  ORF Transcript_36168/g.80487 Transcript_36168/m.80487 type:complete len:80 (+) Transcript_36168:183-422(+)
MHTPRMGLLRKGLSPKEVGSAAAAVCKHTLECFMCSLQGCSPTTTWTPLEGQPHTLSRTSCLIRTCTSMVLQNLNPTAA